MVNLKQWWKDSYDLWPNPYWRVKRTVIYYASTWWTHSRLNKNGFHVGDIYEDCAYHPVLCVEASDGDLWGVSLIDGSYPRGCSVLHCGPVKLTPEEAYKVRKAWQAGWKPGTDKIDWS